MRKFPNALVIMLSFIIFSSLLTYLVPHGEYQRMVDPDTNRISVVPGSFKVVDGEALSVFDTLLSIPQGVIERADLVVLILLCGACFYVIEKTGALTDGVVFLTGLLKGKEELILVIVALMFATGGVLVGLQEEIIAMMPVLLLLSRRLGYDAFVAIAISYGAAILGAAFSPVNPFAVVIAQKTGDLPFLSGSGYRLIILLIAFITWMVIIIRYANKNRIPREEPPTGSVRMISMRSMVILGMVALAYVILIYGMLSLNWGFNEISAEFFLLGILVGLVGKLGINGTSEAYIVGFKDMTFAALIVGFANAISIILKQGMIIDTIIYALFLPLQYLPTSLSAIGMMISQALLHFPVPSYSGQAILTMPILMPLSDLIGLSRQVCVLAYQYGAVMMDMLVPTNGALMAIIAIAGVSYNKWFRTVIKPTLIILLVGAIAIVVAIYIGYN